MFHLRTGDMIADLLTKATVQKTWMALYRLLLGIDHRYSMDKMRARERGKNKPYTTIEDEK